MAPAPGDVYDVGFLQHRRGVRAVLRPASGGDFFSALYNSLLLREDHRLPTLRRAPGLRGTLTEDVTIGGKGFFSWSTVTLPRGTAMQIEAERSDVESCCRVRVSGGKIYDIPTRKLSVKPIPVRVLHTNLLMHVEGVLASTGDGRNRDRLKSFTEFWHRLLGSVEDALLPCFDGVDMVVGPRPLAELLGFLRVSVKHQILPDRHRDPISAVYVRGENMLSLRRLVADAKVEAAAARYPDPGAFEVTLTHHRSSGLTVSAGDVTAFPPGTAGVEIAGVLPRSPAARAGLRTGMRLLAVDGWTVQSVRDAEEVLAAAPPSVVLLVAEGVVAAEGVPPAGAEALLDFPGERPVWTRVLDSGPVAAAQVEPAVRVRMPAGAAADVRVIALHCWRRELRAKRLRPVWQIRAAPQPHSDQDDDWHRLAREEEDALDTACARELTEWQLREPRSALVLFDSMTALNDAGVTFELRRLPPLDVGAEPSPAPSDSGCGVPGFACVGDDSAERAPVLRALSSTLQDDVLCTVSDTLPDLTVDQLHDLLNDHTCLLSEPRPASPASARDVAGSLQERTGAGRVCAAFLRSVETRGETPMGRRQLLETATDGEPFLLRTNTGVMCAVVREHRLYMLTRTQGPAVLSWRQPDGGAGPADLGICDSLLGFT